MSGSTLYCLGEAWLELESPASLSSAETFRPRVGGSARAAAETPAAARKLRREIFFIIIVLLKNFLLYVGALCTGRTPSVHLLYTL